MHDHTHDHLRSSHWPITRAAHLAAQPACQWCGGTTCIEVHHILPFHLHPELELDPSNLITLCEASTECHLEHGHKGNWTLFEPRIVDLCRQHHPVVPQGITSPAISSKLY